MKASHCNYNFAPSHNETNRVHDTVAIHQCLSVDAFFLIGINIKTRKTLLLNTQGFVM